MKTALTAVAVVVAAIIVFKLVLAVSAIFLAIIPAAIALGCGYTVGQIHGRSRERARLEKKAGGPLPR